MTTIINNPGDAGVAAAEVQGMNMGVIIGILLALIVIALFAVYFLPNMLGNSKTQSEAAPAPTNTTIQIELPATPGADATVEGK